VVPSAFQIQFWNDVPAGADDWYSHPGTVWPPIINCTNFTSRFVGWDYDPRSQTYEACFLFEQTLLPHEWFYQEPGSTGTNIYWLSIGAVYSQTAGPWPWGWKTRPRDTNSLAPDDAVISDTASPTGWWPIYWPTETDSWDLAFELISGEGGIGDFKWEQLPDLSTNGMDVNATAYTNAQPPAPPYLLADDFECKTTGPITNITIWGSWFHDYQDPPWITPSNVTFTLSIHTDIPATNQPPYDYSMPGLMQKVWTFGPGQYACSIYAANLQEGWLDPPAAYSWPGDFTCYQYDFKIPAGEEFTQEGTPANPVVYWLDVQAQMGASGQVRFGWKTSITNWHDDAAWVNAMEEYTGPWNELVYPPGHLWEGETVDMAFRLNGTSEEMTEIVKWSQPPVPYSPPDVFNGWNELSWYGEQQIVADDWLCISTNPVTDIHWWGSFIGWNEQEPPQLPDEFRITFWTDTPVDPTGLVPFSHPSNCVWQIKCTNYTWQFVGWDMDPRDPLAPLEACFRFDQDLMENEWFRQNPEGDTNLYWISIAAVYTQVFPTYPWGWKTRPRDTNSLAPDDAVRIFDPTDPIPGMLYNSGEPIYWPDESNSWDMAFQLTTRWPDDLDFGDAPTNYPTLLANNGARHFVVPGFCLGALMDTETDGQPDPDAKGDDNNNLSDEDGVNWTGVKLTIGQQSPVVVTLTSTVGNGKLDAWVDFDRNGTWDATEQVFNSVTLVPGANVLNLAVPANAKLGPGAFARFRLSSTGLLPPAGAAQDGEVEDCAVTIGQPSVNPLNITNYWGGINWSTQNFSMQWSTVSNGQYQVQFTGSLSNAPWLNWTNLGGIIIDPTNWIHDIWVVDTNAAVQQKYYRVVAPYVWP